MTHIAVLVPGLMGSELRLDNDVIWPGPLLSLWLPYERMAELMRDDLVATDVIRSFSISEQYGALISDLATCEFRENDNPPTLVVFPYDWRKDNRFSARLLADRIDAAVAQHAAGTEVSIIAHSLGGLIARYYLESGDFTARPGFPAVRRLITLGTPHRGSPLALTAALGMEKRLFLNADQVLQVVSDPRYPSVYQLLPPAGEPFAWDEQKAAAYQHIDIYQQNVARMLGLVQANLDATQAFHSKLDMAKRPPHVRYFFFVGTRQTTISTVTLLKTGAKYRVRRVEPEDAGDGTVPSWSAAVTGVQGRPVGGEHGTIYKNDDLRRTLAALLGKAGVLAAIPEGVEVALRERVSNPQELVRVALTFGAGVNNLDGELRVERARLDTSGQLVGFAPASSSHPIRYTGLTAEKLNVTFTAPNITGIYRVAYYPSGRVHPAGSDELFVQASPAP